jgi:hypothetical protein
MSDDFGWCNLIVLSITTVFVQSIDYPLSFVIVQKFGLLGKVHDEKPGDYTGCDRHRAFHDVYPSPSSKGWGAYLHKSVPQNAL